MNREDLAEESVPEADHARGMTASDPRQESLAMDEPEPADRRQHPRRAVIKKCKVRDRRTASFAAGETSDLSDGGALIRVERCRPFGPGDEVDFIIDWDGRTVLSSRSMVRAKVRRVSPIDHQHQSVALEFKQAAAAALAA